MEKRKWPEKERKKKKTKLEKKEPHEYETTRRRNARKMSKEARGNQARMNPGSRKYVGEKHRDSDGEMGRVA